MVKVRQDLTGMMFGNLLVIEQAEDHVKPNGKHLAKWRCQCTCGNITEVRDADLKTGNTKSCGCQNPGKAKVNEYQLNLVDEHGSYGIGYTSNTNEPFYFDMEDYDTIKEQCWCSNKRDNTFVLMANIKGAKCHSSFARFIMPETNTIHMDKNPFNNRRYNLVECNTNEARRNGNIRQNNSSGVSGVSFNNRKQKWTAAVTCNGPHFLGYYDNKDDAIISRLVGEAKYFGEFAPQMHLCEQYGLNPALLNAPGNDIIKSRRRGNLK